VTIVYFRDLPPERTSAISSCRTEAAPQPNHQGQELARHSWLARLREWRRRRRSRVPLSHFNDRMLKDIGITYAEAEHEANKPFWLP
jgi:uncharacterized protein YjiS (DUF1127 family)